MDEVAVKILEAYGLEPRKVLAREKGYRNTSIGTQLVSGEWVNILIYKPEAGIRDVIKRANSVGNYLADKGLPARQTMDPRILCLNKAPMNARRYAGLHNYLPGTTIAWEAYTKNHIKALGMALGILHAQLREYSGNLPSVCEIYSTILDRMDHYFQGSGVQQAMFSKLGLTIGSETCARLASLLRFCDGLSDQQALHMDFVRGNILFASASKTTSLLKVDDIAITGILDFEKVAYGHPAFDIARTLAFLLVDCKYKPADKVRKYFLHSGYAKRGGATLPATDLLEQLTDLFLLHDFYKFLRHNPYESLSENEHYSRTVQLLITRGLIESETEMVK